jgi:hypothetical protein
VKKMEKQHGLPFLYCDFIDGRMRRPGRKMTVVTVCEESQVL